MTQTIEPFAWPEGKKAAVSLSFDDARTSQLDVGMDILNTHKVKASFYIVLANLERRLDEWRQAADRGHELGCHTLSHPCSGNFPWSRSNALEEYTLERMETELTQSSARLEEWTGRRPQTFAYPCGQKFVGRGLALHSYVPLVARHFLVGRGFRDEAVNHPACFDPAQAAGVDFDRLTFAQCLTWLERAVEEGGWLIFAGHDVGEEGVQTVRRDTLEALCRYCQDPANSIWIDTVAEIGSTIRQAQSQ